MSFPPLTNRVASQETAFINAVFSQTSCVTEATHLCVTSPESNPSSQEQAAPHIISISFAVYLLVLTKGDEPLVGWHSW